MSQPIDWENADETLQVDRTVAPVDKFVPGYTGGMENLFEFINGKIAHYDEDRNDPTKDGLSNISPWLHFGKWKKIS